MKLRVLRLGVRLGIMLSIMLTICLTMTSLPMFAAVSMISPGVTLDMFKLKGPGDKVTIQGTATFTEVTIEVQRPDKSIMYINAISVVNGVFSDTITLPVNTPIGIYKVVVGQDVTVAVKELKVIALSVRQAISTSPDQRIAAGDLIKFMISGGQTRDLDGDGGFGRGDIVLLLGMITSRINP